MSRLRGTQCVCTMPGHGNGRANALTQADHDETVTPSLSYSSMLNLRVDIVAFGARGTAHENLLLSPSFGARANNIQGFRHGKRTQLSMRIIVRWLWRPGGPWPGAEAVTFYRVSLRLARLRPGPGLQCQCPWHGAIESRRHGSRAINPRMIWLALQA